MTNLLDRVLNGYRGADTSAMEMQELRRENMLLSANLSRLAGTLAQNRLEVERLRRSVRRAQPSYSWLIERAELDAKGLYAMHSVGLQPSRRNAKATLQMSERRWMWARALAMLAGVHDGNLFTEITPDALIQRLHESADYAVRHPDALREFKAQ